ncbi:hypothetical protein LMTR13_12050 [Bradyrhizobium icense]|uniref:Uncharacterized protein n=1 Tax=Bradyrhizobium icense TaxID=1274631 RepID=A0A1B1UDG7_9BRAD|nr:hypothetical protein LMTR13_12050 [Bradyrhizobium icense]
MTSSVYGRYDNIWGNIAHGLSVHHGSARSGVHEAIAIWDDHIAIYSDLYAHERPAHDVVGGGLLIIVENGDFRHYFPFLQYCF